MSTTTDTTVIIVGGSLVGLSSAVFLAARGVSLILLERHQGSSPHPRAIGFTTRTMELFRTVGVENRIPTSTAGNAQGRPRRTEVESLAGLWREEKFWASAQGQDPGARKPEDAFKSAQAPKEDYSPAKATAIAQDHLEPILRERAIELGAHLRLGYKMTSFSQDEDKVTVTATDSTGQEVVLTAKYMIACDGARSSVREALNIKTTGVGHLRTLRSILFRCQPIEKYLEAGFSQFSIKRSDFEAFLVTYRDGRWALMWNDDSGTTLSEEAQKQHVLSAIKDDQITLDDVELLTQGSWPLRGAVAENFSIGRVFLAGDAAHALPPNRGGWGANTGISDAHNLAWKIDAVHRGLSDSSLLETYSAERLPVALLRHDQIFAREDYQDYVRGTTWATQNAKAEAAHVIDDVAMELGQIYKSSSIVADLTSQPETKRPDEWNGQPGTRAPHVLLQRGDKEISSLDLFCTSWVILSTQKSWADAATKATQALGWKDTEIRFFHVGEAIEALPDKAAFETAYGVSSSGASLVRPDGFIAWRAETAPKDQAKSLLQALQQSSFVKV